MCVESEGNRISYEETRIESGARSPTRSLIAKDKDEREMQLRNKRQSPKSRVEG